MNNRDWKLASLTGKAAELRRRADVIDAAHRGETIQLYDNGLWESYRGGLNTLVFDGWLNATDDYRIAPTPKYRPWTREEADMKVGSVVRHKIGRDVHLIMSAKYGSVLVHGFQVMGTTDILAKFEQLDGSPCGALEQP